MKLLGNSMFTSEEIRQPKKYTIDFNYTEWQKDLFDDMSVEELSNKALEFAKSQEKKFYDTIDNGLNDIAKGRTYSSSEMLERIEKKINKAYGCTNK